MKEKDAFFPIYFFFNGSKDLKGFSKYLTYESTILIFVYRHTELMVLFLFA